MRQDLPLPGVVAAAAVAGGGLGVLSARVLLVGSGLSLVPWAVVGISLGVLAGSRRRATPAGGVYGFLLAYAFMVAGYDGEAALSTRLVPFLLFGAVGAAAGIVLAWAGAALGRRLP